LPAFLLLPPTVERRLPEIDRVFRVSYFCDPEHHGEGEARVQKSHASLPLWTGLAQLLYKPTYTENAWVEIPFTVNKKEPEAVDQVDLAGGSNRQGIR
jgi:hypothetical protein